MMPQWAVDRAMERDPREEKLPKWALETLRVLRASLAEQAALAQDALRRTNPEAAKILLDPYEAHGGIGLPTRTTVRFETGAGHVEVTLRDGWVVVRGSDNLEIRPRVSNGIEVRDTPRGWSAA